MATRIMAAFLKVRRPAHQVPLNFNSFTLDTFGFRNQLVGQNYGLINEHVNV